MNRNERSLHRKLNSLIEGLEEIRLDDGGAWAAAADRLEAIGADMPARRGTVKRLLHAAAGAVRRMGCAERSCSLALVEAVSSALRSAAGVIAGEIEEPALAAIEEKLRTLEPPAGPAGGEEEVSAGGGLHEALARLLALEAEDRRGWSALAERLAAVAAGPDLAPSAKSSVLEAERLCREQAAAGRGAGGGDLPARVGALLEEALAAAEEGTAASSEPPPAQEAKDPGDGEGRASDAPQDWIPPGADPDLLAEFITESNDLIQNAEEALLSLEHDPDDLEAVGRVFRAFHTIKGTAGFLELTLINELGHHAESLLSRVREGEIRYRGGYADLCLQALDTIKQLIAGVERALAGGALLKPEGYDRLLEILKNPEAHGVSEEPSEAGAPRIGDILVSQGKVEREAIEEALERYPGEKAGVAIVKSQAASLADVCQALRVQKQMRAGAGAVESSVRVSTQRLDRLIDMVGELVIAHSMVAQDALVTGGGHHGLAKKVAHTSKIVRELQDISMSMRMVPLKATFNKMARLARDVGRKLGKNVAFVTEGEDTEIDRNLVDVVNDPLVHMVRNAVDHGIESPEERRAAGKPEQGTVKIAAFHSAGSVVVEISDDGKGLDREAILAKARERGLVAENAEPSDREVFNLIFEPGFSTAKVVTDVSGRGVGMDVVKKNIELLRGTVEIRSEKGKGSVFRMSLPLTLAIIDGMVIRVAKETYVLPTIAIVRSVKPSAADLHTVFGQGEMLRLQGRLIPLVRLAEVYHLEGACRELAEAIVVVVEDGERQAGLVVDELVGRQQVVIKSLGETMKNIPGISGGAILPNGRVGLILDVGGLLRFAAPERRDALREEAAARMQAAAA
ncbi:MAG: chemotaxis protein CheA [Desulfobacterales bacterium]